MTPSRSLSASGGARRWAPPLLVGLMVLGLALYCMPFLFRELAHNYREIYTYNLDSMILLRDVQQSFYRPHFQLDFTDYGQLYYNISLALTFVYSLFAHPDAGDVFLMLRLASFLGTVFTLCATFLFARFFLGPIIALFCTATLALSPMVVFYSVEPHPDSWQMFFVTLSVFLCALAMPGAAAPGRARRTLDVVLLIGAAAAAGAAFSTKYIGIVLFPLLLIAGLAAPLKDIGARAFAQVMRMFSLGAAVLVLPLLYLGHKFTADYVLMVFPRWRQFPAPVFAGLIAMVRWGSVAAALASLGAAVAHGAGADWDRHRALVMRLLLLFSIPIVFAATFALTSPWAVWKMQFLPSVFIMSRTANYGIGAPAPWYGFHWLTDLSGPLMLGPIAGVLALIGIAYVGAEWRRQGYRIGATPLILVVGWVLLYALFLVTRINLAKAYYLLPMVPATAVMAGVGLTAAREYLSRRVGRVKVVRIAIAAAALLCLAGQAYAIFPTLVAYRAGIHAFIAPEKQQMAAWLLRCVPHDKRIMTAAYAYIPPQFNAWLNTDQGDYGRLVRYRPDVVILNRADIDFFRSSATQYLGITDDIVRYFDSVARSPAWRAGPDFGTYRIFLTPELERAVRSKNNCL